MVSYSAKLRMNTKSNVESAQQLNERVLQVLGLMGLLWCKDRLIAERPATRGKVGGELRKLSIAVEIINLPPVILLDDITRNLDAIVSEQIMECLKTLANRGHTIICALPRPPTLVFNKVNRSD